MRKYRPYLATLALAVRICANLEFISENAKTNLKQYFKESIRYNFKICER